MGSFAPQIQVPQSQQSGKGSGTGQISQQPFQQTDIQGLFSELTGLAGGKVTTPNQGGQPEMGMPNAYQNTVQPYNQQQPEPSTGKGSLANSQFLQNATGKGV